MAFERAAATIPDYYSAFSGGAKEGIDLTNALEKSYQTAFTNEDQRYHAMRKRAAVDAFQGAWTSGDPNQIQKVMGMFPEYAKDIQSLIGMRDDQHRKDVGTLSMQMKALADSGDFQGAKALLDKSGGTIDSATAGTLHGLLDKAAAGDQGAVGHLGNLFQGITLAALKPKEIMDWGTQQQQLAQQLQQINNQFILGQEGNQLGWGRLNAMNQWHEQMLNNPTPFMKNWDFIQNLPPDKQEQAIKLLTRGGGGKPVAGAFNPLSPTASEDADAILQNMTAEQTKNAQTGHHMERDLTTMASLLNSGKVTPQRAGAISKALGSGDIGNLALNPNEQKYVSALKDTVNTVLRKESGAAISESEWKDAFDRYLPSMGDSKELANQKFNLLRGLMHEYQAGAGGAYPAFKFITDRSDSGTNTTVPSLPSNVPGDVQDILNKYPTWKGGK